MPRKPEPILTRVARGLRITPDELAELIRQRTNDCILWQGAMSEGRPRLWNYGNPARALYEYACGIPLDQLVYIRNGCGINECINPWHQDPVGCEPFKKFRGNVKKVDVPPLPSQAGKFDEEEVEDILKNLDLGLDPEELRAYSPKEDYDEAIRRYRERS